MYNVCAMLSVCVSVSVVIKSEMMWSLCVCVCVRVSVVIKSEMMWSLMRRFSSGDPTLTALPPRAQRDLISSLVQCGVGETRQHYLTQVLRTLHIHVHVTYMYIYMTVHVYIYIHV